MHTCTHTHTLFTQTSGTHNLLFVVGATAVGGGQGGSTLLQVPGLGAMFRCWRDGQGVDAVGVAITVARVLRAAPVTGRPHKDWAFAIPTLQRERVQLREPVAQTVAVKWPLTKDAGQSVTLLQAWNKHRQKEHWAICNSVTLTGREQTLTKTQWTIHDSVTGREQTLTQGHWTICNSVTTTSREQTLTQGHWTICNSVTTTSREQTLTQGHWTICSSVRGR